MIELQEHDRPTPAALLGAELAGERILVDELSGRVIHLNRSAALVWWLCDGGRTVGEICELLGGAFPDHADVVDADVRQAVAELRAAGALLA